MTLVAPALLASLVALLIARDLQAWRAASRSERPRWRLWRAGLCGLGLLAILVFPTVALFGVVGQTFGAALQQLFRLMLLALLPFAAAGALTWYQWVRRRARIEVERAQARLQAPGA